MNAIRIERPFKCGHPITPENIIRRVVKSGVNAGKNQRVCRACRKRQSQERHRRSYVPRPRQPRMLSPFYDCGHERTDENTYFRDGVRKGCLTCQRARGRAKDKRIVGFVACPDCGHIDALRYESKRKGRMPLHQCRKNKGLRLGRRNIICPGCLTVTEPGHYPCGRYSTWYIKRRYHTDPQWRAEFIARSRDRTHRHRAGACKDDCDYITLADLFERDGYDCYLCGTETMPFAPPDSWVAPEIDHVIPLNPRAGEPKGTHTLDNVAIACKACNSAKSNLPLDVYLQHKAERTAA